MKINYPKNNRIRRVWIRARETNNMVERLYETFKHRVKLMRDLKNDK